MSSWRDVITVHPAADLFPLMGDAELADDIKANGLATPIAIGLDEEGKRILLDGRNRLDAMERVGLRVSLAEAHTGALCVKAKEDVGGEWKELRINQRIGATVYWVNGDATEYIISANIKRRHLTGEQKRDLIGKLLELDPSKSNRQVAAIVGVDHKTVAPVRLEKEEHGDIPRVAEIVDTKGRNRPVNKPKSKPEVALAEMGKVRKTTKNARHKLDAFFAAARGLLFALEMTQEPVDPRRRRSALTIAMIVQEMDQENLGDIKALKNWLNRLLAMSKAPPESKTNTVADMPDIPAKETAPPPTGDDETSVYVGRDAEWDALCDEFVFKTKAEAL